MSSITPHQAKYFAYEHTKQSPSNTVDKFAATLANVQATVDLNPHQIDAALFALRSPLSKGANQWTKLVLLINFIAIC